MVAAAMSPWLKTGQLLVNLNGLGPRPVVPMVPQGLRRSAMAAGTRSAALHTMWMPRSCTSNDMNAASTPYDLVLARRA